MDSLGQYSKRMEDGNAGEVNQSSKGLDWTSNFSEEEIDEDLASFQEDEMVQQALQRGVDLKKYGRELENDLRQVSTSSYTC